MSMSVFVERSMLFYYLFSLASSSYLFWGNADALKLPSQYLQSFDGSDLRRLSADYPCLNLCSSNSTANCTEFSVPLCLQLHEENVNSYSMSIADIWLEEYDTSWIYINWTNVDCEACENNARAAFSPVYRIEVRNANGSNSNTRGHIPKALQDNWIPVGLTCDNFWSLEWKTPIDCEKLQFRVSAQGQCLQQLSSYSEVANLTGLRLPPLISGATIAKMNQSDDDFFKLEISWKLAWSKWSVPIESYDLTTIKVSCPNNPNTISYPTKIWSKTFYNKDKTIAYSRLQVHYSSIGCRFGYRLTAQSKCKTKSDLTFIMDLIDCSLVPENLKHHCIIPPVDPSSIHVSYAKLDVSSNGKGKNESAIRKNVFCVTWKLPLSDSQKIIHQIAWQTSTFNRSALNFEDNGGKLLLRNLFNYNFLGNTSVSGDSNCTVIECDSCVSRRLHFKVLAIDNKEDFVWDDNTLDQPLPCFNALVEKSTPTSEIDLAASCPCYYTSGLNFSSLPSTSATVLMKCNNRIPRPEPSTSTSPQSAITTTEAEYTTASATDYTPPTTGTIGNRDPVPANAGLEIWLPISIVTILLAATFITMSICIYRARKRVLLPPITVDKLREVFTEVSTATVMRQASQLSDQTISSTSGRVTEIPLSATSSLSSGDAREIVATSLMFTELLGEGSFGKVMKATLATSNNNNNSSELASNSSQHEQVVAVKLVPDNADPTLVDDFLSEITITKRMGRHPCLVNMIACITLTQPVCLVVEYCENGDLLSFLHKQQTLLHPDGVTLRDLNYIDLLTMAKQIALGMEFISVRGFIHRDLACRNIMVDGKRNAKIGDFGLARYVYDNSVYFTRIGRALPIRWMPPEALYDRKFSSASDVWSFGILLYELVTLGASPYPGVGTHSLVRELRNGYHMERPATRNCPDTLYSVMCKCWSLRSDDRPSFSQIVKECNKLLAEWTSTEYVDISLAMLTIFTADNGKSLPEDDVISEVDASLPNFI